jgi:AcrR family transcriptional regulator
LFAEKGYAATSVAEVAAAAGASVQTIYDSVGSKAELVSALNDLIGEEGGVAPLARRFQLPPLSAARRAAMSGAPKTTRFCVAT